MKRFVLFVSTILLAVTLTVGCEAVQNVQDGQQKIAVVQDEIDLAIADIERELATLPEGDPLRATLEEKLVTVRAVKVQADKVMQAGNEIIDSVQKGEPTPGLKDSLAVFGPYGAYAGFAISVLLGLKERLTRQKYQTATENVVKSWEAVGPELSPEDKKKAAAIQGKAVTALVHEIKETL